MKTAPILISSLSLWFFTIGASLAAAQNEVTTSAQLLEVLSKTAPGGTIQLASGTFQGAIKIPTGVTLRGAGHTKTTLDVGTAGVGISIGGDGVNIADLSLVTNGGTGIKAEGTSHLTLSGLWVRGGTNGILLRKVESVRIENSVLEGSLSGLVIDLSSGVEAVNNTFHRNDSVAISLHRVAETSIFNNVVAHAGVAIAVRDPLRGLKVDHNLYLATYVGKIDSEHPRLSLGPWKDISGGMDARSVQLPVSFQDSENGDYRPVSVLDWNPSVSTVRFWGVESLGGARAPAVDMAGGRRPARPSLGAREPEANPLHAADGEFKVTRVEGTKSAGVFKPDGTLVRYLFRDLPLPPGTYDFVLPSRTELGATIPDGAYELRLVEGNLSIRHRMLTANNGVGLKNNESDTASVQRVMLQDDNILILGGAWSERAENVRAKDIKTGKAIWSLPGTRTTLGLCRGGDGLTYILQPMSSTPPKDGELNYSVFRLDAEGHMQAWPNGQRKLPLAIMNANGIAELGGSLYVTCDGGEVYRIPLSTGKLELAFKTRSPFHPTADRKRNLLWMVSGATHYEGGKVTAFAPDGKVMHILDAVPTPLGVSVAADQMAVADYEAGTVRFFNIAKPDAPVAGRILGLGDGPFGPVDANRFWFQKNRYTPPSLVSLDLLESGRIAVLDDATRPLVFAADGTNISMGIAQFGNAPYWARFPGEDNVSRFYDPQSQISWTIDTKKGTWKPEARWGRPLLGVPGNTTKGFFKHQDSVYGVMSYVTPDEGVSKKSGYLILRYDDYNGKIVAFYAPGKGGLVVIRDENGDGVITTADGEGTLVLDSAGKPVNAGEALARFSVVEANGDIRSQTFLTWVFKGVDDKGCPIYEFPAAGRFHLTETETLSPYDFETKVSFNQQSESTITPDGDLLAVIQTQKSPNGVGLSNSGGVDLLRFRKDGRLRWFLPMNDYGPVQGVKSVTPGFILTSWGHQGEWIGLDDDGLSIGHVGFPVGSHWDGYWLDHPDHYALFKGNDGGLHILAGDYFLNGARWMTLENYDNYRKASFPFTVSSARAAELAARPPQTTFLLAKSEKPKIVIKKLARPLTINGDLTKWRALDLSPQILITPSSAGSNISGASDSSATIRLAYEGKNLYVQVLRFDDVPTFHQTIAKGTHIQDTVEMMINGFFPNGFQFSIGKFSTDGEQIVRRRFFAPDLQLNIPAEVAPRVVKVLDDARDVPERKLIEAATGEDLSGAKVIVTEYMLPLDNRTWKDSEKTLFPVESGKGMWLGFMVDDNDAPDTDLQKVSVWPPGFSTFSTQEDSARVTFE